jgi:hypothetical protein
MIWAAIITFTLIGISGLARASGWRPGELSDDAQRMRGLVWAVWGFALAYALWDRLP